MFNLLPSIEQKKIRKEYIARLAAACLVFLLATGIAASVFLLPSYIFSLIKERAVAAKNETIRKSIAISDAETLTLALKAAKEKISIFKPEESAYAYEFIGKLVSLRPQSVTLSTIDISRNEKNLSLHIIGKAGTRDDLITFQNKLENDKMITNVELPVSNLLLEKNINFSIKALLKL
jgi:hypothetical protein